MSQKSGSRCNFKEGWYSTGLGEHWNMFGTYGLIPIKLLPKIDMQLFNGKFFWLPELSEEWEKFVMMEDLSNNFLTICKLAANLGIKQPESFLNFMGSPYYQNRMVSSTNCYFELPKEIVKSTGEDGGHFIRFMNDEQDAMLWYLYIDQKGNHSVATTKWVLDSNYPLGISLEKKLKDIVICSPSFEEFIYRFWIENKI